MRIKSTTLLFLLLSQIVLINSEELKTFNQIKSLVKKLNLKEPEDLPAFTMGLYKPEQITILRLEKSKGVNFIQKHIESYPTLLKELEPILQSKQFRFPEPTGKGFDINSILELSNFLTTATNYYSYKENKEKALEYAKANLKFSNLILQFSNKNSLCWLAAMVPVREACASLQNLTSRFNTSVNELNYLIKYLPKRNRYIDGLKTAINYELESSYSQITDAEFDKFKKNHQAESKEEQKLISKFDPKRFRKYLTKEVENLATEPYKDKILPSYDQKDIGEITRKQLAELGALFIYRELNGIKERTLQNIAIIEATKLIIACKQYELKHEKLPQQLNELVPDFIKEIPRDPFDHKPFRYNASKKLIYSVGPNLIDSKGMTKHQIRRKEKISHKAADAKADLVFHLERTFKIR